MSKLASITLHWLFGSSTSFILLVFALGVAGFCTLRGAAQEPGLANSSAANSTATPGAQFGAIYGTAAGQRDGTLKLAPRPNRSLSYVRPRDYRPAYGLRLNYEQQYRSAFKKAYLLAYNKALITPRRRTEQPGATAGSGAR
jgi:hypothetical protein